MSWLKIENGSRKQVLVNGAQQHTGSASLGDFFCTLVRGTEEMKAINYELGIIAPGGYVVRTLFFNVTPHCVKGKLCRFCLKGKDLLGNGNISVVVYTIPRSICR